eukprot:TRINITY_DN54739_c0_g1_i1.p1 TRINITY_DN54739_c0_g1~~TRINITY_DN54739_c0_g1_i1.p1  ORF type:complete len:432 (-),score=49.59 TRINITY_DN54739_c0_g1_i1:48-1343(-)
MQGWPRQHEAQGARFSKQLSFPQPSAMVLLHKYAWMSYLMHEVGFLSILVWLCVYAEAPGPLKKSPRLVFICLGIVLLHLGLLFYAMVLALVRRRFRTSHCVDTSTLKHGVPTFKTLQHRTRDGVDLNVRIAKSDSSSKVMLLACPLGMCGTSTYNPIMCWFGPAFTYVSWDYRGFFGSEKPRRLRKISIPEHAEDAFEVLQACGYDKADVMVGHSMGTAVSFEAVLQHPEKVGTLILMNGFHGHVFNTAFQPIWRYPAVGDILSSFVSCLLKNPNLLDVARRALQPVLKVVLPTYARWFGSQMLVKLCGDTYLVDFLEEYLGRICETRSSTESFIQLFQELDAHSVYHLLSSINHPTLLISGLLDVLTPAMQTFEIERQMPRASHYCDPFSGHASILESPEWCVAEIDVFIREHVLSESSAVGKDSKKVL